MYFIHLDSVYALFIISAKQLMIRTSPIRTNMQMPLCVSEAESDKISSA